MTSYDIPYWKKYTLSIEEAASYFRIGEGKLRKLVSDNPNAEYLTRSWIESLPRSIMCFVSAMDSFRCLILSQKQHLVRFIFLKIVIVMMNVLHKRGE